MKLYRRNLFHALLLAGLIMPVQVKAQAYFEEDARPAEKTYILKWTPTALLDFYPSLQFAFEYGYTAGQALQLEYGLIMPEIARGGTGTRGHRIRLEHRTYFGTKQRWYYAPELHFITVNYNVNKRFSDSWYTDSLSGKEIPENPYRAQVGVHKMAGTANLKLGLQYDLPFLRLVFDVYAGLGLRVVDTRFTSYPSTGRYVPPIDNFLFEPPFKEGTRVTLNGIAGFKIGYRFR